MPFRTHTSLCESPRCGAGSICPLEIRSPPPPLRDPLTPPPPQDNLRTPPSSHIPSLPPSLFPCPLWLVLQCFGRCGLGWLGGCGARGWRGRALQAALGARPTSGGIPPMAKLFFFREGNAILWTNDLVDIWRFLTKSKAAALVLNGAGQQIQDHPHPQ